MRPGHGARLLISSPRGIFHCVEGRKGKVAGKTERTIDVTIVVVPFEVSPHHTIYPRQLAGG